MGHVQDLWMKAGPRTADGRKGRKVRSNRWGHGKRWLARWGDPEQSMAFGSKDAAEAHLAQMAVGGAPVRGGSFTVATYSEKWLRSQVHYAAASAKTARERMRVMILPTLADRPLTEVTRTDVQDLGVTWTTRYAPASVHLAYSFLTSMYADAVRDGHAPASPCAGVNLPTIDSPRVTPLTIDSPRVTPLTIDQVETIADRVQPWYRSMVIVGAATGLRGGELRGMTVDRVDDGDLVVNRQMLEVVRGVPVYGPPKSAAGYRRVSLGSVAGAILAEHLAEGSTGGLIWTTRQGGPVDRKRAGEVWRAATAGMGLKERSGWHELRHHHASLLIAARHSPRAVADRLGHADPAETLRTYVNLWPIDHARMTDDVDLAMSRFAAPSGSVSYLADRAR